MIRKAGDIKITPETVLPALVTLPDGYRPLSEFCTYERGHEETREAWEAACLFCEEIAAKKKPARWLSLLGVSGVGKTMLSKAIKECVQANRPKMDTAFFTWDNIVNKYLRKGDYGIIDFLSSEVGLLIIDDIGVEDDSKFTASKLSILADRRLGRWTVLTSNFSFADISDRLDARIASRMVRGDSKVVQLLTAPDWSLEKYKKQ